MESLVALEREVLVVGTGNEAGADGRGEAGADGDASPRDADWASKWASAASEDALEDARLGIMSFSDEGDRQPNAPSHQPGEPGVAGVAAAPEAAAPEAAAPEPAAPEPAGEASSGSGGSGSGGSSPNLERDGDQSFVALYAGSYAAMVRLAYALTGSREIAEDLVQDSFVRLHRHWVDVRQPHAYLQRAVVNACRSNHRRKVLARRHEGGSAAPSSSAPASEDRRDSGAADVPAEDEVGEAVGAASVAAELMKALNGLPYRQKAALVLRFYADLSEAEIAGILRCRPGTVGSLVHRGLDRMREVVER